MSYSDIETQIRQVVCQFGDLSAEWIDIVRKLLVSGMSVEDVVAEIRTQKNSDEPPAENIGDGPQG